MFTETSTEGMGVVNTLTLCQAHLDTLQYLQMLNFDALFNETFNDSYAILGNVVSSSPDPGGSMANHQGSRPLNGSGGRDVYTGTRDAGTEQGPVETGQKGNAPSSGPSAITWIEVILPIVCALGISGNLLNLIVLTKKRLCAVMGRLERSANLGLTALALSDLLFNLVVMPFVFVSRAAAQAPKGQSHVFVVYYRVFGISIINLFLMTSTWLIVALAVERYIVLFYPLRAKWLLSLTRTKAVIGVIYALCTLLTVPYFLRLYVQRCQRLDGDTQYEILNRWPQDSREAILLDIYVVWVWPSVAVFIPLCVLLACNVRLIQGLRQVPNTRRISCPGQTVKDVNNRITMTLVVIVCMALCLITPAEILKVINPYKLWGSVGHVIATVANLLQSLNFAFNFVLYCVIDRSFRSICKGMLTGECHIAHHVGETEIVLFNKKGVNGRPVKSSFSTVDKMFF